MKDVEKITIEADQRMRDVYRVLDPMTRRRPSPQKKFGIGSQKEKTHNEGGMLDMEFIEKLRAFGEMKNRLETMQNNDFVQWVMRIGESRNILNNALIEFENIKSVMTELEKNIPQFHKQPGSFREMEQLIKSLVSVLRLVNHGLSYVQKETDCAVCKEEPAQPDSAMCKNCYESGESNG
jgi:hypothetical protein